MKETTISDHFQDFYQVHAFLSGDFDDFVMKKSYFSVQVELQLEHLIGSGKRLGWVGTY